MKTALHHIAISTYDLDRCVRFYERHFDGKVMHRNEIRPGSVELDKRLGLHNLSVDIVLLAVSNAHLEVFQFHNVPDRAVPKVWEPGYTHFCLQVEDCLQEFERLADEGVRFVEPPLTMPSGATFVYGLDPDENVFELLEIPEGATLSRVF